MTVQFSTPGLATSNNCTVCALVNVTDHIPASRETAAAESGCSAPANDFNTVRSATGFLDLKLDSAMNTTRKAAIVMIKNIASFFPFDDELPLGLSVFAAFVPSVPGCEVFHFLMTCPVIDNNNVAIKMMMYPKNNL